MNDTPPTLAEVFNFINSVHDQCRNLLHDTVRFLRDSSQIYLNRKKEWDWCKKPNDRYLDQEFSLIRRTQSTYLPAPGGDIHCGALFSFEFFHPRRPITPQLLYGTLNPGDAGFSSCERWTTYYTIVDVEQGKDSSTVESNGKIAVVKGTFPRTFVESHLVCVPLDSITDEATLTQIVVEPLTDLLRGDHGKALERLDQIETLSWPSVSPTVGDGNDDVGTDEQDEDEQP